MRGETNGEVGFPWDDQRDAQRPDAQRRPKAEIARDKLYTFDDVARLVCKGADPPAGLALHFRRWARPLEGLPNFPRPSSMSRREMVEALKKVAGAADVIWAV